MRLRFATIELFPKRQLGEENQAGTKLVRITPTTGGAGRKLLSKLLGRAGVAADASADRAGRATERSGQATERGGQATERGGRATERGGRATERDPHGRPKDAGVEDPPER